MAIKTNRWWFIGYPESLSSKWLSDLESTGLPFIVSPLHDQDVDDNGKQKKEHYHIMIFWQAPTTFKHVNETVVQPVGGTMLKPVLNTRGAFDYLTHEHNSNKAHYSRDEIKYYNGSSIEDIDDYSASQNAFAICFSLIEDKKITSFRKFVSACREFKDPGILNCCINYSYFWKSYLYDRDPAVVN